MEQTDAIRDYVFPIFEVEISDDGWAAKRFRGTGFFLGNRGSALTAAHVVANPPPKLPLAAILPVGQHWRGFGVDAFEEHPTEDIALLSISPPGGPQEAWRSIVTIGSQWVGSSAS